jgi:hypothetical protein
MMVRFMTTHKQHVSALELILARTGMLMARG